MTKNIVSKSSQIQNLVDHIENGLMKDYLISTLGVTEEVFETHLKHSLLDFSDTLSDTADNLNTQELLQEDEEAFLDEIEEYDEGDEDNTW